MTWEVRAQRSTREACVNSEELGWSSVFVDTQAEEEAWFECRTRGRRLERSVHVLFDPTGAVQRVAFCG